MKCEVVSKENNEVKFHVTVDNEKFEEGIKKAYNKLKGQINIPGFRKGKVPRRIIEQQYGEEIFYEEAVNEILPEVYSDALDELDIEPIDQPELEILEIGKGKNLKIEFVTTVSPEPKLGQYKGLELEKIDIEVTDEDVENEIEQEREKNARLINVEDRAIEEGDTVTINFEGKVDGETFEGGSAEGETLEIGSESFIPGFEDQLVGKNVGEEVEVKVTFPENYQAEDLAGKEAVFTVDILSNKTKDLPELNDEFAKDVSEFDTLEEWKEDIRKTLEESNKDSSDKAYRDQVIEKAIANMEVEVPEAMIDHEIDGMIRNFEMQLQQQGMDMSKYFDLTNSDEDALKENMRDDAIMRVKTGLLFDAIEEVEEIEITDEDIKKEYEEMAEQQDKSVEEIKELFGGNDDYLKDSLTSRKIVDFLLDEAEIVE